MEKETTPGASGEEKVPILYLPMKMRTEYTCPLELVHDMLKGKWKPIILWRLRLGTTSLAKLERDIDGITQKMPP